MDKKKLKTRSHMYIKNCYLFIQFFFNITLCNVSEYYIYTLKKKVSNKQMKEKIGGMGRHTNQDQLLSTTRIKPKSYPPEQLHVRSISSARNKILSNSPLQAPTNYKTLTNQIATHHTVAIHFYETTPPGDSI